MLASHLFLRLNPLRVPWERMGERGGEDRLFGVASKRLKDGFIHDVIFELV